MNPEEQSMTPQEFFEQYQERVKQEKIGDLLEVDSMDLHEYLEKKVKQFTKTGRRLTDDEKSFNEAYYLTKWKMRHGEAKILITKEQNAAFDEWEREYHEEKTARELEYNKIFDDWEKEYYIGKSFLPVLQSIETQLRGVKA